MVMTGFAPSKLFETPVDPDRLAERLKDMRKLAEFDPEADFGDAFGLWKRIAPELAREAELGRLVKMVKAEEGLDLGPILTQACDDVKDAIIEQWADYTNDEPPTIPDGVLDTMLEAAGEKAAVAAHHTLGRRVKNVFEYPQLFLDWVCELVRVLADGLIEGDTPIEVCVQVPNVDIPLDLNDATVMLIWGYQYGGNRRTAYMFELPWYGRHVVKEDWMAYARLVALRIYRDLPGEFKDEED